MKEKENKCGNCAAWHTDETDESGQCRRRAPTHHEPVDEDTFRPRAAWLITLDWEWCAEWIPLPVTQGTPAP